MAVSANVPYDPLSGVTPAQSEGLPRLSVQANPNQLGAQIGAGAEKLGASGEEVATQYGKMSQEAHAEDLIANQFVPAADALRTNFYSLKGKAAVEGQDNYVNGMENLRQKFLARDDISPYAKQIMGHYMMQHAAQETDFSSRYVVQQNDDYIKQSNEGYVNLQAQSATNNYTDPAARNAALDRLDGSIQKYGHDTGQPQDYIDAQQQEWRGKAVDGMVRRAANDGDLALAKSIYGEHRDGLSAPSQEKIEAFLVPKTRDYDSYAASQATLAAANKDWYDNTYGAAQISGGDGPTRQAASSLRSNPNNLGNVKTPEGARDNTPDFLQPATPVDGVAVTANNLRGKNYVGKTLDQIGHTWTSTNADDWVKNVSAASGISPQTVPDLNDAETLKSLMKGIAVAEKPKEDRALFTDDVIAQGVQSSLSGRQPVTAASAPRQSLADYYRENLPDISKRAFDNAMQQYPGDVEHAEKTSERAVTEARKVIQQQEMSYKADADKILQAMRAARQSGQAVSIDDVARASPDLQKAWDNLNELQPQVATRLVESLNKSEKGYGSGYLKVANLITGAPDDPQRITGYSQLIRHFNDDELTPEGLAKAEALLKNSDAAKAQVSSYNGIHKLLSMQAKDFSDPKGEALWADAVPMLDRQLAENRGKQIPDYKSYDPADNDYIGNAVKPLMRSPSQMMVDRRAAALSAVQAHAGDDVAKLTQIRMQFAAGKLKGDAGASAIRDAYSRGWMSRQTAEQLALEHGYIRPAGSAAPAPAVQVPRPE